ncbi:Zn(2)-Cys(6) zinc finger domain protein [Pleurostoma richardsiae]|uniref:Zn(2)-Cys(6) zinc finger domain protein n=1 Tax=Pleurostoma richardsiae TaxID=41990 RepID=A0AA38RT47_9PEZI|nr:Zn(2)-Cys(6) zinc finger domain protein [Pleurostoma richardsiae]
MGRKGAPKVKTGCITCKIRKVKCDEARPCCSRCTSTGRKCDGYPARPPLGTIIPWRKEIVCSVSLAANVNNTEARALRFFQQVVAPAISSRSDSRFWTSLVLQAASNATTVRHAVIAVSSLYEDFAVSSPKMRHISLHHYNLAIRHAAASSDQQVVLLVCILFVCVEFLRGNVGGAIDHCQHGIRILNDTFKASRSKTCQDEILGIFRRLSIFPFFFGSTPATFPELGGLDFAQLPTFGSLLNLSELQQSLDILVSRSIRLIRNGDPYRLKTRETVDIPAALVREKAALESYLVQWKQAFNAYKSRNPKSGVEDVTYTSMEIRHRVALVWVYNTFTEDERVYDEYAHDFQHIVDLAEKIPLPDADEVRRSKFLFEMDFLPLLYFVVIKCRWFEMRLGALRLMNKLASKQESLWAMDIMNAVGKRVIEIEHGVSLEVLERQVTVSGQASSPIIPGSEVRIMDSVMEMAGDESSDSCSKRVTFILSGENSGMKVLEECIFV